MVAFLIPSGFVPNTPIETFLKPRQIVPDTPISRQVSTGYVVRASHFGSVRSRYPDGIQQASEISRLMTWNGAGYRGFRNALRKLMAILGMVAFYEPIECIVVAGRFS